MTDLGDLEGRLSIELTKAIRSHMITHSIRVRDVAAGMGVTPAYITNALSRRPVTAGGRASLGALQRILDTLGLDVRVEVREREAQLRDDGPE